MILQTKTEVKQVENTDDARNKADGTPPSFPDLSPGKDNHSQVPNKTRDKDEAAAKQPRQQETTKHNFLKTLVWVNVGKTEHQAWLLESLEGKEYVWVEWISTVYKESVLATSVSLDVPSRRSRSERKPFKYEELEKEEIEKRTRRKENEKRDRSQKKPSSLGDQKTIVCSSQARLPAISVDENKKLDRPQKKPSFLGDQNTKGCSSKARLPAISVDELEDDSGVEDNSDEDSHVGKDDNSRDSEFEAASSSEEEEEFHCDTDDEYRLKNKRRKLSRNRSQNTKSTRPKRNVRPKFIAKDVEDDSSDDDKIFRNEGDVSEYESDKDRDRVKSKRTIDMTRSKQKIPEKEYSDINWSGDEIVSNERGGLKRNLEQPNQRVSKMKRTVELIRRTIDREKSKPKRLEKVSPDESDKDKGIRITDGALKDMKPYLETIAISILDATMIEHTGAISKESSNTAVAKAAQPGSKGHDC